MAVKVRVTGIRSVVRGLRAVGLGLDDLRPAFTKISGMAARVAAGAAPVKTGRLRGNVRGNRAVSKAVVTSGGRGVEYAGPINYGRDGRSGARYMQEADRVVGPKAPDIIVSELNKIISREGF